jgi:hypothetical protein
MAVDSSEGTDLSQRRARPRRHWGRRLGCIVLVSLLAGGLYLASLRHYWRAEFHRRIEAVRAAGFPVTGKELDAWYPWPSSGENAANWITGAATIQQKLDPEQWKLLEPLLSRGGERLRPAEPLSAEVKGLLDTHIEGNSKALEALHEAAAIPECRYPIDLSKGLTTVAPHLGDVHLGNVREDCRLLGLETVWRAENGDPNGAVRAVEAILQVARSLDQEPILFSHLVRMAGANEAVGPLERVLSRIELTEEQLARLQKAFDAVHGDEGLVRALAGSRCMYLMAFQRPQSLDREQFSDLPPVPVLEVYHALGFSSRAGTFFLDYMEECLRICQLPAPMRRDAADAADARARARGGFFLRDFAYTAYHIRREAQETTWLKAATAALAVERYRVARGGLPETLDQLVPGYLAAVPEDPVDGAPLRYKQINRGFVVYGVGEDRRDDGGKEEPRARHGQTYDLVFRVERPVAGAP